MHKEELITLEERNRQLNKRVDSLVEGFILVIVLVTFLSISLVLLLTPKKETLEREVISLEINTEEVEKP